MPGQLLPLGVVVVLVAVVHGDAGEAGQDREVPERVQVPPAQVEHAVVIGGGRQDVAFAPGRAGAQGRLVEPDDIRRRDQRLDQRDGATDRGRAPGEHAVTEPGRGAGPAGEIGDQLGAPGDRDVLVDQQVHDQRLEVGPVAARGRRHLVGQRGDMPTAAGAADPVHIVLAHPDPDLGQVMALVGPFDAHLGGLGQVRPAGALAVRAVRNMLIGLSHPRQ